MTLATPLFFIFAMSTALQYAGGLSYGKGVCPSVRLSVTRVNCDKTNESSAEFLVPYERQIHIVFRTQRMVGGDAPLYLKFWVKLTHPASKTAILTRYSLVAAQPLELAKKVQLENVSTANALQLEAGRRPQSQSALIRRAWQV